MLNSDKTELLVLNACHRPLPPLESITVGFDVIHASHTAKNIGVWFDEFLSMDKQLQIGLLPLCNIARIRIYIYIVYSLQEFTGNTRIYYVKTTAKKCTKKVRCTCKVAFLLIRPIVVF